MTEEDYQFNLQQVRRTIRDTAARYPLLAGLVYRSPYDFVTRHGIDYRPGRWTGRYKIGLQLNCFGNALVLAAAAGLKYVEGFALAPDGQCILHAWNAQPDGELIDTTWANTGLIYLGVEFSAARADDAIWNGDACILNDEHRNYPVFQQLWPGEDYRLEWPPSARLEYIKNNLKVCAGEIRGN